MRVFDFNSAIVRAPGKSVVAGIRANPGPAPSFERIMAEHGSYVAALRAAGVQVTVLEPQEQFPDSVFIEDPALVFSQAAVLLRPGAPTRLAEADGVSAVLAARFPRVLRLSEGFAEGGDILATPDRVFIGVSTRTSGAGAAALKSLLESMGLASEIVDTPRGTLHLKTASSLIDEETILATAELAQSGVFDDYRVLIVPDVERAAANVLRVNDVVLVNSGYPRTADILSKHGVPVVPLESTEIAKIDAGLTCMSLRWFNPLRS